jgi:hypothetical protein
MKMIFCSGNTNEIMLIVSSDTSRPVADAKVRLETGRAAE